jgi:hypothetical protein
MRRIVIMVGAAAMLGTACRGAAVDAERAVVADVAAAPGSEAQPVRGPGVPFSPAPPAYAGPLPPLPAMDFPPPRPLEVMRAVFTFAARHPEVLHYVPCFCGCQQQGHKDNDDCFIAGREPNGRPRWEPHGMT